MEIETYSHRCAPADWQEQKVACVVQTIRNLKPKIERGCSSRLRELILKELRKSGWSSEVKLSCNSLITITATNGEIGLCLQTGNMSRFYADLLKLQYLFQKGNIKSAIYLLPAKHNAVTMGSNLAHFERFVDELQLFAQTITIPLFVIGLN